MDSISLGANIKKYRKGLNMTQGELAEKVGITTNYLRQIELGYRTPALEAFVNIVNELGLTADVLLKESILYDAPANEDLIGRIEDLPQDKKDSVYAILNTVISELEKHRD